MILNDSHFCGGFETSQPQIKTSEIQPKPGRGKDWHLVAKIFFASTPGLSGFLVVLIGYLVFVGFILNKDWPFTLIFMPSPIAILNDSQ